MKSPAPTPRMTAAGILHYQAFLPTHFHAAILHSDYRIDWQRPAWPRVSISGWGRSQTCQWFQSSRNASQPLISHKYQKEAAEFSVGLLCNVGLTMWTHTNYPSSCIRVMSHAALERFQVSPLAYRTGTRHKAHVDSYVCPHSNK